MQYDASEMAEKIWSTATDAVRCERLGCLLGMLLGVRGTGMDSPEVA